MAEFPTLEDLAGANVERYITGKKTQFAGVGVDMLRRFQARAKLATVDNPVPYLKKEIVFPTADTEFYFDIETDPLRGICYLHGFVVRKGGDNSTEQFFAFFAEDVTPAGERDAFAAAWTFIGMHPAATVYIYSKYERTIYRKLAEKYPDVCSVADIDALFAPERTVDLCYDVVWPYAEFPTLDFSIKSVAKCLGFEWRDTHPSGAASIQWFDAYVKTGGAAEKQRILDYNEDDCRAMRVLVDGIRCMKVRAV